MNKVKYIALFFTVIFSFFGCDEDPKYHTSHPEEGGVILTMDWSKSGSQMPDSYDVYVVLPSNESKLFEGFRGATNTLVVPPGKAMLYVFNAAENITRSGEKVTINNAGYGITSNPGLFYSWSGTVTTERDRDIPQMASMKRQMGELKLSIAIKPASMIDKVKSISAVFDGVASEFDMSTNEPLKSSSISTTLPKSTYYATTTIRSFGFISSAKQNLRLEIELENGNTRTVTHDLTSLLEGFNNSKESLFTLNAEMNVSNDATTVTVDNWTSNTESRYLSASPSNIDLSHESSYETINIATDQSSWVYSVIKSGDWLTITETDNSLRLSVENNDTDFERKATINISAGGINESITITQDKYSIDYYYDMEVVKLQSATVGNGVNIVLMGDGYIVNDMVKKTGKYEKDMREATEHFFSVYPYTKYRNHFNVYMVAAISNEKGISNKKTNKTVDNRFKSIMEGGESTGISSDVYAVIDYLNEIEELWYSNLNDISVIMPINENTYAGTCAMYLAEPLPDEIGFAEGFTVSMVPVSTRSYRELIVHEAGGHGFAKVRDEYIYNPNQTIPYDEKEKTIELKTYGWCENIDFSADIMQTSWRGFANNSKYRMVSTFEGALMYGKGVWRPEFNSCMNDNVFYFNAPTRWAQVRRIKKLAGIPYSFSQFLQDDVVPVYPTSTRSKTENFKPLAPPIIGKLDKNKLNWR